MVKRAPVIVLAVVAVICCAGPARADDQGTRVPGALGTVADPVPSGTFVSASPADKDEPGPINSGDGAVAQPTAPRPVITLSFDGGLAEHAEVARILDDNDVDGVFYIDGARLNSAGYLSTATVRELQKHGHEIGGYSTPTAPLTQTEPGEQGQVCTGRNRLLAAGVRATDFAYPPSELTAAVKELAHRCGYDSARSNSGLGCSHCPQYETLPVADRFSTRAMSGFGPGTRAEDLIEAVRRVPAGQWLHLVFGRTCAGACDGMRRDELKTFVRWLSVQSAAGSLRTATTRAVLGSVLLPAVPVPAGTAQETVLANGSLEQSGPGAGGAPLCFDDGEGDGIWRPVADAHSGRTALRVDLPRRGTTARLSTVQDPGRCTTPVRSGGRYRAGVWYKSTRPITVSAFLRGPDGTFRPFGAAVSYPPSPVWALAGQSVGPVPTGAGQAIGLAVTMTGPGGCTVDDFFLTVDTSPGTAEPVGPADGGPVTDGPGSLTGGGQEPTVPAAAEHPNSAHPLGFAKGTRRGPHDRTAVDPSVVGAVPATSPPPGAPFVAPAGTPPLADVRGERVSHQVSGRPGWLGWVLIGGLLLTGFAALVLLDRRLRYLHRRFRTRIPTGRQPAAGRDRA